VSVGLFFFDTLCGRADSTHLYDIFVGLFWVHVGLFWVHVGLFSVHVGLF